MRKQLQLWMWCMTSGSTVFQWIAPHSWKVWILAFLCGVHHPSVHAASTAEKKRKMLFWKTGRGRGICGGILWSQPWLEVKEETQTGRLLKCGSHGKEKRSVWETWQKQAESCLRVQPVDTAGIIPPSRTWQNQHKPLILPRLLREAAWEKKPPWNFSLRSFWQVEIQHRSRWGQMIHYLDMWNSEFIYSNNDYASQTVMPVQYYGNHLFHLFYFSLHLKSKQGKCYFLPVTSDW